MSEVEEETEDAGEHVIRAAFHEVQSDGKKMIPGNGWSTRGMWKDQSQMAMVKKEKGNKSSRSETEILELKI